MSILGRRFISDILVFAIVDTEWYCVLIGSIIVSLLPLLFFFPVFVRSPHYLSTYGLSSSALR